MKSIEAIRYIRSLFITARLFVKLKKYLGWRPTSTYSVEVTKKNDDPAWLHEPRRIPA